MDIRHEESIQKEMDRYVVVITAQTTSMQKCIARLTEAVGKLRIDVQVVKVLIERMEQDRHNKSNSN